MNTLKSSIRSRAILVFAVGIGAIVFAITQISYWIVEANTPAKHAPVGLVGLAMDVYSYYSFIWQAKCGHWLFNNAMTSEPCDRIFFNLQWLLLGKCMAWFGWTPQFAFIIWRFTGAMALILAFAVLAIQVLPRTSQRIVALIMCAFGGGFGWFISILGDMDLVDTSDTFGLKNPAMDLITPVHPFGQILKNPHYSLPHGTFLLFVCAFIQGERTRKTRWYFIAAAVAIVQGLMRPYDVITICALIPIYSVVEAMRNRSLAVNINMKRALPLLACLPLLAYFYYIFSVHEIFKWWAIQGKQLPTPATWHTLSLGLAGFLFLYRLLLYKKLPLTEPALRFLIALAATLLGLYHANHISDAFSFSPQIAIPLMAPMILVGLSALPYIRERHFSNRPGIWTAMLCAFLAINSLSSPLYVLWSARIGQDTPRNYARQTDLEAMGWLKNNAHESDVILSNDVMGGRIAFNFGGRVALGHWALTPHVKPLKRKFARFAAGELSPRKARRFIEEISPRYIYVANMPRAKRPSYFRRTRDLQRVYFNDDVAIYEMRPRMARAY
ncbi:MAG: hypothetical protein IT367_17850 [Candidatus Hydrogenedentes bacterium]|nr:hypothetical protein [Candidatus Hydrogenedentota bacterium]